MRSKLYMPTRTGSAAPQYSGLRLYVIVRPLSYRSIRYGPLPIGFWNAS